MKLLPNLLAAAVLAGLSTAAQAEITIDVIGGSEVSIEGLLQADAAWYDNDFRDLSANINDGEDTDFNVRRAEFIVKGKGPATWNWVVGYDFSSDKFLDVNASYRFSNGLLLTVGQYKQPNSLEELGSTRHNDFISKSMTTNLQSVARRLGASLQASGDNWTLTGSVFDRELTRRLAHGQGYGLRGTFTPFNASGDFMHLGLSWVDFEAEEAGSAPGAPFVDGDGRARFRVRPDADLTGQRLIDSGQFTDAERIRTLGAEFAWVHGPVKVQAEYMTTDVGRRFNPDFNFDSWYVQGLYNVTGETWGYRNGVVTTGLPDDPSRGLWQLGLRYDHADLNDGPVQGGVEDNWTVGVNWYWHSNFRLSANYVMVDSERQGIQDDPNIFELRGQFTF
jgi:phosphate-selective porin OprO/OprP